MFNIFNKTKELNFKKTYEASAEDVWNAWTSPEALKQWWGPKDTSIVECEVDLRVGGKIVLTMEAGAAMGSYAGTKWPMKGSFTVVEPNSKLSYEAISWTQGEEGKSEIEHLTELSLSEVDGKTEMNLKVTIKKSAVNAMLASFGMKFGYDAQFVKLGELLNKK